MNAVTRIKGGDAADAARAADASHSSLQAVSTIGGIAIAGAMAKAFSAIEAATKSANNPHFKSKYADLGSVIDAIKPALTANGLFFTQHPVPCEGGVQVETHLHHESGDHMALGSLFVPANKNDAQAYGSALTYARRYALVTAFGVPVEDDDGNAASRRPVVNHTPQKVNDSDLAMIAQLCRAVGGNQVQLICSAYTIDALPELTPSQAQAVIGKLNDKLAARAKAESDKEAANV